MIITVSLSGSVSTNATIPQKEVKYFLKKINSSNNHHYDHDEYRCEVCYTDSDKSDVRPPLIFSLSEVVSKDTVIPQKVIEHFLREINSSNGTHYDHSEYQCEVCYTNSDKLDVRLPLKICKIVKKLCGGALEGTLKTSEMSKNCKYICNKTINDFKGLNPPNVVLAIIFCGGMFLIVLVTYFSYHSNNVCSLLCDNKHECKYKNFCEFYEHICYEHPTAPVMCCLFVITALELLYFLLYKPASTNQAMIDKANHMLPPYMVVYSKKNIENYTVKKLKANPIFPCMIIYSKEDIKNRLVKKLKTNGWFARIWRGRWSLSTEID